MTDHDEESPKETVIIEHEPRKSNTGLAIVLLILFILLLLWWFGGNIFG